jgi:hypothetical protein
MRSSTSSSAAAVRAAAVKMLQAAPTPPPHARAFGFQLLACCSMDASGCSSHILSLSETIFLINACSSSVTFDPAPNAALETANRDVVLFAPSPYPLVLPLPSQSLPPLHVAAAAGVVLVPMLFFVKNDNVFTINQFTHTSLQLCSFCSSSLFSLYSYKTNLAPHQLKSPNKMLWPPSILLLEPLANSCR